MFLRIVFVGVVICGQFACVKQKTNDSSTEAFQTGSDGFIWSDKTTVRSLITDANGKSDSTGDHACWYKQEEGKTSRINVIPYPKNSYTKLVSECSPNHIDPVLSALDNGNQQSISHTFKTFPFNSLEMYCVNSVFSQLTRYSLSKETTDRCPDSSTLPKDFF